MIYINLNRGDGGYIDRYEKPEGGKSDGERQNLAMGKGAKGEC